eukprot:CAMPEP_0197286114 /NCGR_PEP_ID=MMETSP0890-20130614/1576_1 /TAXON_ID=44058 ORGANISM="Aureoumbra lagunensis, Strain CCMP1510" /NCGR_SAMPLE_ID=MMETSP0890 /ASSEMBLY_ACC=CAM_ASM_000533 /LENGTH=192 /DNA_ID=CAMNT_0042754255 /DNA_START=65 /DNA_END=643 /DNA_ORIENTATION=+
MSIEEEKLDVMLEARRAMILQTICTALPKNIVQCDLQLSALGIFAVGTYRAPIAVKKCFVDVLAEKERNRRVSVYGTSPQVSYCNELIKSEIPRNLLTLDTCRCATGVFAVSSRLPRLKQDQSCLSKLLEENSADKETTSPTLLFKKAASINDFHLKATDKEDQNNLALLSTSPTSVIASHSVGDLVALVAF